MVAAENAEQPVNHGTQWKPPTEETAEDIEAQYKIMAAAFGTRRRKEPT
jgi:hypothetical protein